MKLKLQRREKKTREIKQQKKIKNHNSTSKTNKPEAKHFKLHQENLEDNKIEHKQEEQTENRKQLKGDNIEKEIETSSQKNKQKENIGETKLQNIPQDSEKEICIGCSKYVETGVQCGSCCSCYHYKCEGTTEKEIKKLPRGNTLHM